MLQKLKRKGIIGDSFFILIDWIFIIIVFFAITTWIDDQLEDTAFEKSYLARDIALLIDSLQSFNNIIYVDYPQETFWFDYSIEGNKVIVSEKSSFPNNLEAVFPFIKDNQLSIGDTTLNPKEKPKSREGLFQKFLNIRNYFIINPPDIKEENKVQLAFLRTGSNLYMDEKEILETNSNLVFCQAPMRLTRKDVYVGTIAKLGDDISNPDMKKFNVVASILTTQDSSNNKYIKIYIPFNSQYFEQSNSLACYVINQLSKEIQNSDEISFSIIPKEAEWLFKDKIHLVVEQVNTNINANLIGTTMTKTIEDY